MKHIFILFLFLSYCTWTSPVTLPPEEVLALMVIYNNIYNNKEYGKAKILYQYSCDYPNFGSCLNSFASGYILEFSCGNGGIPQFSHCPQENFKKMCIIRYNQYNIVDELILYDLSKENEWRNLCESSTSMNNVSLEYKDTYEIKEFY